MRISKKKFDELFKKNELAISLIGMSNIGKTFWSNKLREIGFKHFSCDDLIEDKLAPKLKKLGYGGIAEVSKWMGQPYDKRFAKNQEIYLNFEKEVLKEILAYYKKVKNKNIVIDTTGSFAHCGDRICKRLQRETLVVYLEATNEMREEMFARYMKDPKPVTFANVFKKQKGERDVNALARCYPKLLSLRSKLYNKYADIVIPYEHIRELKDVKRFLGLIGRYL